MSSVSLLSPIQRKQHKILTQLRALELLPKTEVTALDGFKELWVKHAQVYVPDFRFVWCNIKNHYRVYIHIANQDQDKTNAGYTICTVGTGLAAMGFGMLYSFLHKHRANNKEAAYEKQ